MTNPKSRAAAGGTRRTEPVASRDGRAGGQPPAPPAGEPAAPRTPASPQGSRLSHIQMVSVESAVAISTAEAATRRAAP